MIEFIISQLLGLIALIFIFLSLQNNNKNKLLYYQMLSSFFLTLQYLFLNAMTGFYLNLLCIIRNLIFKQKSKAPIYYLLLIVIAMLILGLGSYKGVISLLPTVGVIINTIGLWQPNLKITRLTELFVCVLVTIYNIKYFAFTALIATLIEFIIVLRAIYRFDIVKNRNS